MTLTGTLQTGAKGLEILITEMTRTEKKMAGKLQIRVDRAHDVGLEEELLRNSCINSIVEARKNCTTRIAAEDMYDTWKSAGLVFGKLFQTVLGMLVDHKSDQAVARISSTVPLLKKLMPFQYAQHHFIHPPTLDATLQVCLPPIISNPEQKVKNAITPMFIKELWKKYRSNCIALEEITKDPMIILRGLIATQIDTEIESSNLDDGTSHRPWNIDQKPDPEVLSRVDAGKSFGAKGDLLETAESTETSDI
ncbi:hypothetical protein F4824DRAFT_503698 [Ustulina deusta]|nr:hypothetical protein F4824DRAFT_503698 [Ustulina deusta]